MAPFFNSSALVSSALAFGKMIANVEVFIIWFGVCVPTLDTPGVAAHEYP